jgi:TM2 domain-containing membrane protein YozV
MVKTTTLPPREFLIALILSIFVGYLGIDRMYLGKVWTGLLKLITAGGLGQPVTLPNRH